MLNEIKGTLNLVKKMESFFPVFLQIYLFSCIEQQRH